MGPNFAVQHMEAGATIQSHTKLIIRDLVSPSQSWLKIDGSDVSATMPSSVRFQDIVFEIPNGHVGCFLDLGDYSEATNYILGSGGHARFRHLSIQDCYFTIRDMSSHDSGGTKPNLAWLRDTADGFILQRAISDFCVRASRCYDANIKAAFRGGSGPQLWLATCDVPNTETRHIQAFQALRVGVMDKDEFEAVRGVPGRLDFYIETPLVSGVFGDAGIYSGRVETGYSNVVVFDSNIE